MISWRVQTNDQWTLIEFSASDLLDCRTLNAITLPSEIAQRTDLGLIISGRGPIWLYAHLTHLAHHFAWVATYEPRMRGAIVVQSHKSGGPVSGDLIPVAGENSPPGGAQVSGRGGKSGWCDESFRVSTAPEGRPWRERLRLALFVFYGLVALTVGSSLATVAWTFLRGLRWPSADQALALSPANPAHGDVASVATMSSDPSHALPGSLPAIGWIVWLAALSIFFSLAFWLYRRRFHVHRRLGAVTIITAGIVLLIAGHIVVLGSHEVLIANSFWIVGAMLVLLPVSVWQAHRYRRVLTGVSSLSTLTFSSESDPSFQGIPPIRHLILPLSAPNWRPDWTPIRDASHATTSGSVAEFRPEPGPSTASPKPVGPGTVRLDGRDIDADIKAFGRLEKPKWQQMLRAIQPHLATLDTVWLVGSSGTADALCPDDLNKMAPRGRLIREPDALGSYAFLDDAARLIRPYLRPDARIVRCDPAEGQKLRFEQVERLQRAMLRIATEIQRDCDATPDEIVIDATGGMKTTSIVGAVSTLNNESRFQYIDTGKPHSVYLFDQRLDVPPEVHGV